MCQKKRELQQKFLTVLHEMYKKQHLILFTDAWTPQINGVVTTLSGVLPAAAKYNFEVTVIHPYLDTFRRARLFWYPEIEFVLNPWRIKGLVPYIGQQHSIHIVTEGPIGWAARAWCRKNKLNYTTGYHTNYAEYLKRSLHIPLFISEYAMRRFHNDSSAIFVPSKSTRDKLVQKGYNEESIVLWSRGADRVIFRGGPQFKNRSFLKAEKINLLYVGRISKEKNVEDFLKLAENSEYHLWVVGDGPERERLEKLYCQYFSNITFVGYKTGEALVEYYAAADVFVFPSKTDTLGIVNIEAMSCGIPVVAYNVEGPRDTVEHGLGGFLGDNLADLIAPALKLPWQGIVKNAERHTWEKAAETFFTNLTSAV